MTSFRNLVTCGVGGVVFRRVASVFTVVLMIGGLVRYAASHASGETGVTNKSTDTPGGCSCHCANPSGATTVTLSTSATTFQTGQSYTFTISVSNSGESKAGCDIAVQRGSLSAGSGLKKVGSQLTHSTPKTLAASWTFTYTAPSTAGTDTIFAAGNAVNGNNSSGSGNCSDNWNFASKYVITVSAPSTKSLTYSRLTIPFGNVRVGANKSDTMYVRSNGGSTVSISSQSVKTGTHFSNTPNTSATITDGSTELQTITFSPTLKGALNDSLIFQSDASTPYQALYLSGTGIQAAFSGASTTPLNTLDFANVPVGGSELISYSFQNTGDDTLFLASPVISGAQAGLFSITKQPLLILAPGTGSSISVEFSPSLHQPCSAALVLSPSNGVTAPQIALVGNGTAPVISASDTTDLGTTRVGVLKSSTVSISNSGDTALNIESVTIENSKQGAMFAVSGTPAQLVHSGSTVQISINYTPIAEQADTAILLINSSDPAVPTKRMVILGRGIAPHMLISNVDTVDFADVGVGSTASSPTVTIANTGEFMLNVTSIDVTPAVFKIVGAPKSIVANYYGSFSIEFKPTVAGIINGRVIVHSDDALNSADTLYLTGTGIKASVVAVSKIDFGGRLIAVENDTSITIRNGGNAPITIHSYALSDLSNVFSLTDTTAHLIEVNDSLVIGLRFTPTAALTYGGSISFVTDEVSANKHLIQLVGTGLPDASVAPTSSQVTGISVWPNPTSASATVTMTVPRVLNDVRIGFFDALGREIGTQYLGSLHAGENSIQVSLPQLNGIVFAHISASAEIIAVSRIVITR